MATSRNFNVLVIGLCNSGKSSLINAMLGQEDLLDVGELPTTSVNTELTYGRHYRLTLYPLAVSGANKPLVIHTPSKDMIRKYCSENPCGRFDHAVITYPFPLLKAGITLIDTVGLNLIQHNTQIIENYIRKADVIIYLMNAMRIYTLDDQKFLTALNKYQTRNLIICYTHMGQVFYLNRHKPRSFMDEFYANARRIALQHTDLGEDAIHFIDSDDALEAKLTDNEALYTSSGMAAFEKFCIDYLMQ